jgi:hypothetical protein
METGAKEGAQMGKLRIYEDGWAYREGEKMVSFYLEGEHCKVKQSMFIASKLEPRRQTTRICINKFTGKSDLFETIIQLDP